MKSRLLPILLLLAVIGLAGHQIWRHQRNNPGAVQEKFFVRPSYVNASLEEGRKAALADIEAHRADVQKLFQERELVPVRERHRIVQEGGSTITSRQLNQEFVEFYKKRIVQNYLETTADTGQVQETCSQFLTAITEWIAGVKEITPETLAMIEAAKQAKSSDPIVNLYQLVMSKAPEKEMLQSLLDLRTAMQSSQASTFNRMYLAYMTHYSSTKVETEFQQMERRFTAIDIFVKYLEEESGQANLRLPFSFFNRFFRGLSRSDQRDALMACWNSGKIAPWITHQVAGEYLNSVAWDHRGFDVASKIGEPQWAEFERYNKMAEDHFLRAWQLAPQYPEPATSMISLAMTGHSSYWREPDWFYEAVHAQIDSIDAYRVYQYSLSPRWGGSYDQILGVARECLATERYDTIVPGQFLVVVFVDMLGETGNLANLARQNLILAMAKQFADGLSAAVEKGVSSPSDNLIAWGNLARILTLGGEYETARKIYTKHGQGILGTSPLGFNELKATYVRGWAFAATGPAKDEVATFAKILNAPAPVDYDPAALDSILERLAQARQKDTQPESQPYYNDVQAVVQQLKAYHDDQWVDLPFDKDLSGWYAHAGEMNLLPDGVLELKSFEENLGIQLTPLAQFQPPFLCDVEVEKDVKTQPSTGYVSLIYGESNAAALYANQETRAVKAHAQSTQIDLFDRSGQDKYRHLHWISRGGPFTQLRLIVWKDRMECYADRILLTHLPMPEGANRGQFTIGEMMPAPLANVIHVRQARVHRLRMTPPPMIGGSSAAQAAEHYRKLTDIDPLSNTFWHQAGIAHFQAGQNQEAVTCFEKSFELYPQQTLSRQSLGEALQALKKFPEAVEQYQKVLLADSANVVANTKLAWIYATSSDEKLRNGKESLRLAEHACQLSERKTWDPLCALALAYAELGQFPEAKQRLAESVAVAPDYAKEFLKGVEQELEAGRAVRVQVNEPAQEAPAASAPPTSK